jgi:hypothetical protein
LPEPGPILLERRILSGSDLHAVRITEDGEVWTQANVHAQIDDGDWSFTREEEAAWERDGAVPADALGDLRAAIAASGFFDMPGEVRPGPAVIHGADHLWTARADGREHQVALRGVPEARSDATDRLAEALEDALDAVDEG